MNKITHKTSFISSLPNSAIKKCLLINETCARGRIVGPGKGCVGPESICTMAKAKMLRSSPKVMTLGESS